MRLSAIDPGKKGGLALWDGTHATCAPMPLLADRTLDVAEIRAWFRDHGDVDLVVIERQQARPQDRSYPGGSLRPVTNLPTRPVFLRRSETVSSVVP